MSDHELDWTAKPPRCTCGGAIFAGSKTFTLERFAAHLADRLAFSEQTTTNVMEALAASGAETVAAEAERDARIAVLGCLADDLHDDAHVWDFGSGEQFVCFGRKGQ